LSSGSQKKPGEHPEIYREFVRELQHSYELGTTFYRAVASRSGMTVTDLEVIAILKHAGPTTAGRLAEHTGLTTGAITGMLNRLEETGLLRRERDPNDGRRVIVRLIPDKEEMKTISDLFNALGEEWRELATHYTDEQLTLLLDFLKRSNTISQKHIAHLREMPTSNEGTYSAPLGTVRSAKLAMPSGITQLYLHTDNDRETLYKARFEGPQPDVRVKDGVITIRYPRRLWSITTNKRVADVTLNTIIPWRITLNGGVSEIVADLMKLKLASLEIKGGMNSINLELPLPIGTVPVRLSGGASEMQIHRPKGAAVRVHFKGWASHFIFDDQIFSDLGNDIRLQSPDYETAEHRYDIEVQNSVGNVTITPH